MDIEQCDLDREQTDVISKQDNMGETVVAAETNPHHDVFEDCGYVTAASQF